MTNKKETAQEVPVQEQFLGKCTKYQVRSK